MRSDRVSIFAGICFLAGMVLPGSGEVPADRHLSILDRLADSPPGQTLIAAHRGGYETDRKDEAPENSVANIEVCYRKGFELYETDIQRTKDGHFVIVHDPTIERETTGTGQVSDMTLTEMKALKKRYRDGSVSEETVATLSEFLRAGRGRTIFKADLKPGVSRYFGDILRVLLQEDAVDQIIFRIPYREADFFAEYAEKNGPVARHLLMFKVSSRQQIDDVRQRFDATTIEIKLRKSDPATDHALGLIRYAGGKGFVVEAHAEGGEADWQKLVDAGVRIFHTSGPSKVKTFLQKLR